MVQSATAREEVNVESWEPGLFKMSSSEGEIYEVIPLFIYIYRVCDNI